MTMPSRRQRRPLVGFALSGALLLSAAPSSALLSRSSPLFRQQPAAASAPRGVRAAASAAAPTADRQLLAPLSGLDSIDAVERDLTTVLKDLRSAPRDRDIPPPFRDTRQLCFSRTWSLDDWNEHTSRWRYIDTLKFFPTSPLFLRLFPQMAVLTTWSIIATWLFSKNCSLLQRFALPLTPLSLVSTFVAALLTLRSNQGLDRLNQGRIAFGKVVLYTRDMAQLIAAFVYPHDPDLGLKCLRHLSLMGWLLRHFLRGGPMDEDIVHTMLNPTDAAFVARHRKPPVAVVARLRQVFHHLADRHKLTTAAEIALDHASAALNECITTTERIVASPIPPLYTAHTGLLLTFYLACLPLALRGSGLLNAIGTVVTTTVVGYAMLGLDEISHLLEQPFRLMPLYQLSKNSMRDVGDAIVLRPPPLEETTAAAAPAAPEETTATGANGSADAAAVVRSPTYW